MRFGGCGWQKSTVQQAGFEFNRMLHPKENNFMISVNHISPYSYSKKEWQ